MDPKNSSTLDPKLKETYERIMGTPVPATPTPTDAPAATPVPGNPATDPSVPQINVNPTPSAPATPAISPEPATPIISPTYAPMGAPAQIQPADQPDPVSSLPEQHTVLQQATPIAAMVAKPGVVIGGKTEGKSGMLPILLGVGAIIFLIVYTFFWVKFFNFPLPFTLPF